MNQVVVEYNENNNSFIIVYLAGGKVPMGTQVVISLHLALGVVIVGIGLGLFPEREI